MLATDLSLGRGARPSHLQEINCVGTEGDINECPRVDSTECLDPGAGVICPNGNVNLSNMSHAHLPL